MKIIEYNTLKNKNMPKYNVIYYLKKYHSPLITGRKAGAMVQVKLILSDSIIRLAIISNIFFKTIY